MTDKWTERLSEYLDGELNETEGRSLEAHLASCAECAATLEELRGVTARAGSLDDRPPAHDLWAGIARRIGAGAAAAGDVPPIESAPTRTRAFLARRLSFSLPQLAAAAVALIVVSGAVSRWVGVSGHPGSAVGVSSPPGFTVATAAEFGGAKYDSAVVELQQALSANQGDLDSTTVRVIQQNLAIIDQAIDQAQRALASDPGNVYLNNHLAGALKRKIELLRRAASLTV